MAEYGQYVAPIQIGKSYADMFKEQMAEIQKQQGANLSSQIARIDANNQIKYKQLEDIYGFKMDGWSPQAVESFGSLQKEVGRRMRDAEFETMEDMIAAISKLGGIHTSLSNHFSTAKSELLKTTKYVDNPNLYPDKTSKIVDDQETLGQKKRYADTLGVNGKWEADLENIDINIPMYGLNGELIQESPYGSVMSHPHLSDPTILSPSTRPIADITPADYAMEFQKLISTLNDGKRTKDEIRALVRQAMISDFSIEENNTPHRISAEKMYKEKYGEKAGPSDPIQDYINDAMRYVTVPALSATSRTSSGSAAMNKSLNRYNAFKSSIMAVEEPWDEYVSNPFSETAKQRLIQMNEADPNKEVVRNYSYETGDLKTKLNLNKYSDRLLPSASKDELDQIAGFSSDDQGVPNIDVSFNSISVDEYGNMTLKGLTNSSNPKQQISSDLFLSMPEDQDVIYNIVQILNREIGTGTGAPDITLDKLKTGFSEENAMKDEDGNPVFNVKFNG